MHCSMVGAPQSITKQPRCGGLGEMPHTGCQDPENSGATTTIAAARSSSSSSPSASPRTLSLAAGWAGLWLVRSLALLARSGGRRGCKWTDNRNEIRAVRSLAPSV
ncbi:hypothetical protein Mapa_002658 [Marchantia paleacea]|nr:hypothetical protein Mapa_002658 [Marchantia paleacea]